MVDSLIKLFIAKGIVEDEPYSDFWKLLGKFMHDFAGVESELIRLLYHVSKLDRKRSGALFGGMRMESARDAINNILDATGQIDKKDRLRRPFSQMAAIGTIRNNLVHWGAKYKSHDKFIVSNTDRHTLNRKSFHITKRDFASIDLDLFVIRILLARERGVNINVPDDPDFARLYDVLDSYSYTWQYKPPQPSPQRKKRGRDQVG